MNDMKEFIVALKAELYIAMRSNSRRIAILLPGLIVGCQLLLTRLREAGEVARDAVFDSTGFGAEVPVATAYGYFVDGVGTGLTLLVLILVALSAYTFAYDRDTGLLRHLLIRRFSRSNLILAKLVELHLVALAATLVLLLVCWVVCGIFWEFGPVVEDGFELIGVTEIHQEILLGLKLALLPVPAAIAFGLLISVITQSTTAALTTALGITLAMDIFKSTLGDAANYLYSSFQPSLIDQSYISEVSSLVRGYSDVLVDERVIQLNTWLPLPEMVLFVVITLILVQRKKI